MLPAAPWPSKRSHQRYERHLFSRPALVTPQTRNAPQQTVPQVKGGILRDWPGQLSQLPPPSVGIAVAAPKRACTVPCRGRAARRSCRLIIRHTFQAKEVCGEPAPVKFSLIRGQNMTGADLPIYQPDERPDAIDNCGPRCCIWK